LYTKLDEILFAALRQEFEVSPGCTIDRLDMVKFLTSVVHQHLSACPDLDKLLNLRDTVLTGRVKKVFPEVEYKRKQIKQDHYRKAYPWQPNYALQFLYYKAITNVHVQDPNFCLFRYFLELLVISATKEIGLLLNVEDTVDLKQ